MRKPERQVTRGEDRTGESRPEELRLVEAVLLQSSEPLDEKTLSERLPEGLDLPALLARLQKEYAARGINLIHVGGKWALRIADDLSWLSVRRQTPRQELSKEAVVTLSIIAYHQPVTRAEIAKIRGVSTSKRLIETLLQTGWIYARGQRKTSGKPLTYGTSKAFLSQFNLEAISDLPGQQELKGTGLLEQEIPVPTPSDDAALRSDEEPLERRDPERVTDRPATVHRYATLFDLLTGYCSTIERATAQDEPAVHPYLNNNPSISSPPEIASSTLVEFAPSERLVAFLHEGLLAQYRILLDNNVDQAIEIPTLEYARAILSGRILEVIASRAQRMQIGLLRRNPLYANGQFDYGFIQELSDHISFRVDHAADFFRCLGKDIRAHIKKGGTIAGSWGFIRTSPGRIEIELADRGFDQRFPTKDWSGGPSEETA